jgi:hypothetical protein
MGVQEKVVEPVGELKSMINTLALDYKELNASPSPDKDKGPGMVKLRNRADELVREIKDKFTGRMGPTNEGVDLNRELIPLAAEIDADLARINVGIDPSEDNKRIYENAINAVRVVRGLDPMKRG